MLKKIIYMANFQKKRIPFGGGTMIFNNYKNDIYDLLKNRLPAEKKEKLLNAISNKPRVKENYRKSRIILETLKSMKEALPYEPEIPEA